MSFDSPYKYLTGMIGEVVIIAKRLGKVEATPVSMFRETLECLVAQQPLSPSSLTNVPRDEQYLTVVEYASRCNIHIILITPSMLREETRLESSSDLYSENTRYNRLSRHAHMIPCVCHFIPLYEHLYKMIRPSFFVCRHGFHNHHIFTT